MTSDPTTSDLTTSQQLIVALLDAADQAARYGYREGHVQGANTVAAILTDLIAELREVPYRSREVLASQAERRLRDLGQELRHTDTHREGNTP